MNALRFLSATLRVEGAVLGGQARWRFPRYAYIANVLGPTPTLSR